MLNGDISNKVPPRVLVDLELIAQRDETRTIKVLRKAHQWKKVAARYTFNWHEIWYLLQLSGRLGFMCEGFVVGTSQAEADAVFERLDLMSHPLRTLIAYETMQDFVNTLPYRTDLYGGGVYAAGSQVLFGSYAISFKGM